MASISCANSVWHRIGIAFVTLSVTLLLSACGGGSSGSTQALDSTNTGSSATRLMKAGPTSSLAWQAPVARQDGSLLYPSEIAQYRVYYKFTYENQFHEVTVPDGSTTELPLSGFSPGIYDFEVTAVDQQGLESGPSQTVQVTVI